MESIFRTVLNMSITGAFIAAVIMLVRQTLKRLPKKYSYLLWLILGIRLVCPFSLSSEASLFNLLRPETEQNVMVYIPDTAPSAAQTESSEIQHEAFLLPPITETVSGSLPKNVPEYSADPIDIKMLVCSAIWLAGVCAVLIYVIVSYIRVSRLVRGSRHISDNIYVCGNIEAPFVFGLIRPRIYVPEGVSEKDMSYIAAHENTHISRGDHIIKLLSMAILAVHWFNPAVWISYRLMIKDMELSCDERAVRSFSGDVRKEYASALLNMSLRQNRLNGLLAFGESNIKTRIKRVLNLKKPTAAAGVTAVIAVIAAAVCLLTNAKAERIVLSREFGSYSIADAHSRLSETELLNEGSVTAIIDTVNNAKLERITEKELSQKADIGIEHLYTLRMYEAPDLTGECDSVTVSAGYSSSTGESYYFTYSYGSRTEHYLITGADGEKAAKAFSRQLELYESSILGDTLDSDYTVTVANSGNGYEAHSPLTDIYFYFGYDDFNSLTVRREVNGITEEKKLERSFNPYFSQITLCDITGDNTDDIFISTYITGTGVADNYVLLIDGGTMEEIPINSAEAEEKITRMYELFLADDAFSAGDPHIMGSVFEGAYDDTVIYPLYPDKSLRRFGGIVYSLTDGVLCGDAKFAFVKDETKYSEMYYAAVVFKYENGVFSPSEIIPQMDESGAAELTEELAFCEQYLTDYWNDFFKTGDFFPENYIDDPDMRRLANARKAENSDVESRDVERVEAHRNSLAELQSGVTSEGRRWLCFVYDLYLYMEDGTVDNTNYNGYPAYFELEGSGDDMKIYREYELWSDYDILGYERFSEITLPLENADISQVINGISPDSGN